MRNQAQVEACFNALGDPTRRRILEELRGGPVAVGELAQRLSAGRPGVSKHLRVLEGAGLVEHRSQATRNLYALAPAALVPLQQWLTEVWGSALDAYAEHVARRTGHDPGKGTEQR